MPNTPHIPYLDTDIYRAAERRHDSLWITEQLQHPEALIAPLWQSQQFFQGINPAYLSVEEIRNVLSEDHHFIFLGLRGEQPFFALDLSHHEETIVQEITAIGEFAQLRTRVGELNAGDASFLLYARAIVHWHRQYQFCFKCSAPLENRHGGHVKQCTNPACKTETYPRSDPAVIVLVEHKPDDGSGPRCLLGRAARYPAKMYSTLAGFVEPGENLEAAVAREVWEESGVRVGNVVYQGSQPWPFPASLMVGFRAEARSTEITIDTEELEDARWWTIPEIEAAYGAGDLLLSGSDSIARFLIMSWLEENGWNNPKPVVYNGG